MGWCEKEGCEKCFFGDLGGTHVRNEATSVVGSSWEWSLENDSDISSCGDCSQGLSNVSISERMFDIIDTICVSVFSSDDDIYMKQ